MCAAKLLRQKRKEAARRSQPQHSRFELDRIEGPNESFGERNFHFDSEGDADKADGSVKFLVEVAGGPATPAKASSTTAKKGNDHPSTTSG